MFGCDLTGQSVRALKPETIRDAVFAEYDGVRKERRAVVCRKLVRTPTERPVQFESIRLPITEDGETTARIFSVTCHIQLTEDRYQLFGTYAPIFRL